MVARSGDHHCFDVLLKKCFAVVVYPAHVKTLGAPLRPVPVPVGKGDHLEEGRKRTQIGKVLHLRDKSTTNEAHPDPPSHGPDLGAERLIRSRRPY